MEGLRTVVTICAWVLFIYGCVMLINSMVQNIFWGLSGELTMVAQSMAIASFILAAVAAKIRHKIE